MSFTRIWGTIIQEYYITKHSLEVLVDTFFFSVISVIVFGIFAKFISSQNLLAGQYLLLGLILWEVIRISQYSMSVGALWNVWSRNLTNMFVSPLNSAEYLAAGMISGAGKSLIDFFLISAVCIYLFNFNIFSIGILNLIIYFANLIVFSWSFSLVVLGLIFRFGTRVQALSWGLIFLLQPLTATLFPLKILPAQIQTVALAFPSTYIFEATRTNLVNPSIQWDYILTASIMNIVYFVISAFVFKELYKRSRKTGQFVKNEG